MAIIRPRLTDYYRLLIPQRDLDFAVPYLDEDIPLYVDPFLLWKSPAMQDNSLHTVVVNSFNQLGQRYLDGDQEGATAALVLASECDEVGLGQSSKRRGSRMSATTSRAILRLFSDVPQLNRSGFTHFEEIQLLVENVAADRVSDIACSFLKSFLIDYTIDQCHSHGIPTQDIKIPNVYSYRTNSFESETVTVPVNPEDGRPILLVPRRWLRRIPWLSFDDFRSAEFKAASIDGVDPSDRRAVLNYNRNNYALVGAYASKKEHSASACNPDPLFSPISTLSASKKLQSIKNLPTGKTENADMKYETLACQLLASLLFPDMDFAQEQARTDSGVLIRDLIFYNNRAWDFLSDIHTDYESRQVVMELKNVRAVERQHVNQINRYLSGQFGRFGVLVTRNALPKAIFRNTIDLWAGQRRCIISLTDDDLALMVSVYESKNRRPIEVLKKKYIEFTRACPG